MNHYGHNHLQNDWDAEEARDVGERQERAEHEAQTWFNRATVRQMATYRAAMAAVVLLPEDQQQAHRDAASAEWRISTRNAHDLYTISVAEIMAEGETSEATNEAWDVLCDLRAAAQAEAA